MCPPTYFDVEYSINPWMDVENRVDRDLAFRQWHAFVDLLLELGDSVQFIEPVPGLPDMTFAGDAGLVWKRQFVPSNFRHPQRQAESRHYSDWLRRQSFDISPMPPDVLFEGLGDVVFHGQRAFVGYGPRSDERAFSYLQELIPDLEMVGRLEIVDDRYFHLAMALAFDMCTPALRAELADAGYDVVTCDMSEFKKGGGSLRCLVLTTL